MKQAPPRLLRLLSDTYPKLLSAVVITCAVSANINPVNAQGTPTIANGNGDFSDGYDGWTEIISGNSSSYGLQSSPPSNNGGRYARVRQQNYGFMGGYRTHARNLVIGQEYTISFETALLDYRNPALTAQWWNVYDYWFEGRTGHQFRPHLAVFSSVDDPTVLEFDPVTGERVINWNQYSFTFTATDTTQAFQFTSTSDGNTPGTNAFMTLGLDGVSISPTPVPEPSIPILIGLAGLTFIIYRRR